MLVMGNGDDVHINHNTMMHYEEEKSMLKWSLYFVASLNIS